MQAGVEWSGDCVGVGVGGEGGRRAEGVEMMVLEGWLADPTKRVGIGS